MNCTDAKTRLDRKTQAAQADSDLLAHLKSCDDCRDYAQTLQLQSLLKTLPVAAYSEGFAERALDRAWQTAHGDAAQKRATPAWMTGIAASLLLASFIGYQSVRPQHDDAQSLAATQSVTASAIAGYVPAPSMQDVDAASAMPVVYSTPNTVRPVNVRLVSKEAIPDATITIVLDGNVRLAGYHGTDKLSWQAPILAGSNEISLPVELGANANAKVLIEIRSANATKQLALAIQPEQSAPKKPTPI